MLVITLGWLVVFDLVGFSPVDAIPKPTLNRISRFKPSPEEQIVIDETSEIKLRTSRLQNWYHDTCTFTGDIWTQTSSTHNGDSIYLPSNASLSPSAVVVDEAKSQSNRYLFQERQVCFPVCGSAKVSPYITLCCEEGQYCTTVNGIPSCPWSTTAAPQGFSSTSFASTQVTQLPSSQTIDSSSATEGPFSTSEEPPTTAPALTVIVATLITSAFPTQISTRQSSSAASDPQTSTTGSNPSSSSLSSSFITSSSSSLNVGSVTPTHIPTSSSSTASSGLSTSGQIALGVIVPIGIGVIAIIAATFIKRTRRLMKRYLFCCCHCEEEGEEHGPEAHEMGNFPKLRR